MRNPGTNEGLTLPGEPKVIGSMFNSLEYQDLKFNRVSAIIKAFLIEMQYIHNVVL